MNVTLPRSLQTHLYFTLGARYSPNFQEAQQNLNSDREKLQNYLGTYFPRSFAENYVIVNNLLTNPIIRNAWTNKKEFHILDIGAGTGGNLMGFLHAMRRHTDIVNSDVKVISVDGNAEAFALQCKVFEEVYDGRLSLSHSNITFSSKKYFLSTLKDIIATYDHKFDAILCSKSISELYLSDNFSKNVGEWTGDGYYSDLFSFAENALHLQGLLILTDVTVLVPKLGIYMPTIINMEYQKYLLKSQVSSAVQCILPKGCALWSEFCKNPQLCFQQKTVHVSHSERQEDRCHIILRILAKRGYAKSIFGSYNMVDAYRITEKKNQTTSNICVKGQCWSSEDYLNMNWEDGLSI